MTKMVSTQQGLMCPLYSLGTTLKGGWDYHW